ncbi:MAG: flagellar filament capping protein FliD [Selenomonadaceae bacterium]|nr:flagellar filament capping protein FliD [Selenomonadaceae bacterium]
MGVNGIYGLSGSGLDIESMVKVGMMSKQNEYDKMYKKETKATWQKEAYADVYKNINDFNSSKLTDYKLQSKMNAMSASSNNDKAFTVSANGSAVPMTHKVEVKALSSNAYLMSTKEITRKSGADEGSILLSDSMFNKLTDNGNGTYTVKDWNSNTKTVKGDDIALSLTLNDGQSESKDEARTVTMTYADIAGGKTLNDLVSSINKLGLNVTAAYDSVNDSFSLYNKNGGADNTIAIKTNNADTAALFNNFNLGESKNGELTPFSATTAPSIVGTTTNYTGSTKATEVLGISIASETLTTIGGEKVTEDTAYSGDAGVKRYTKEDGSGVLVQTSTDDEGNTVYKTANEPTDGSSVDWSSIEASSTNPVTEKEIASLKTELKIGDDVVTKAADQDDLGDGVTRYTKADGSGNILVKDMGDGTYKTAAEPDDIATLNWDDIEATSENPVSTSKFYEVTDSDGNTTRHDENEQVFGINFNDGHGGQGWTMTYGALFNMTIDDLVNDINSAGRNIKASFTDGVFKLSNDLAGEGNKTTFKIQDELAGKFFKELGIGDGSASQELGGSGTGKTFNAGYETEIAGSNGEIVVDGRSYTNITDNRATIGGVTYTLLDKTETAASVTVTQDQSSIIDRVKQFVEDYNTMLQSLQDKYNETKYSDYDVLTKTQEDGMTKEQIEKWNDKAKSGLLNRDKYIGDIISKMREALSTPVEGISGQYNSAFNIGIRTITDQGKIELDEEKLKKALTAEPNSVYEIFGKMGEYDSNTKTSDFSTSGVAQRLSDVFNNGMKSIKSHAGVSTEVDDNSELGNRIKDWQDKMSDFKTKMKAFEDLLYKKYDAMELALQKLAMTMNYVSFNQQ